MKLTPFFKEQLENTWSQFCQDENDHENFTSSQAVVFSLIRACASGKLPAIQQALDRVDGKVAVEIEVIYPKFYMRFPYATTVKGLAKGEESEEVLPEKVEEEEELPSEPVTNSLRDTLKRMSDEPRALVGMILDAAKEIDKIAAYGGKEFPPSDPKVKSVIVAGLLNMAHNGKMGAVFEVLDQIDGKVADKIKMLGEDVYLDRFDLEAPEGAYLNADGVYEIVADNTTNQWASALERRKDRGNGRRI